MKSKGGAIIDGRKPDPKYTPKGTKNITNAGSMEQKVKGPMITPSPISCKSVISGKKEMTSEVGMTKEKSMKIPKSDDIAPRQSRQKGFKDI